MDLIYNITNLTKYHHSSYWPWNGCVCFTLLSVKFQTVFVTKNQISSFMQMQKHVPTVKIDTVPFCLVVGRDNMSRFGATFGTVGTRPW
jgi:hypothetical protein